MVSREQYNEGTGDCDSDDICGFRGVIVISRALVGVCNADAGKLYGSVPRSCILSLVNRSSFALIFLPLNSSIRRPGPLLVVGLSKVEAVGLPECAGLCDLENLLLKSEKLVLGGRKSFLISFSANGETVKIACFAAMMGYIKINATILWRRRPMGE